MRKCRIERCQQLIISISLAGILLTGTLVALSSTLPMFFSAREHLEQSAIGHLQAQAESVNRLLDGYDAIARQFTSRTEIRRRLESYADGTLPFDELVAYTRPRLQDPMSKLPELLFMRRCGPDHEPIVSLGEPLQHALEHRPTSGVDLISVTADHEFAVRAVATISDDSGRYLGTDTLIFSSQPLLRLLTEHEALGAGSRLAMIQLSSSGEVLASLETDGDLKTLLDIHQVQLAGFAGMPLTLPQQDGRRLLLVPLALEDWVLVAELPESELYASADQQLLTTTGIILLLMLCGLMLTRHTLKPLVMRITQQTKRLEDSATELRLSASVFEHAQEAIIVTNGHFEIQRANRACSEITGYRNEQLIGIELDQLFAHPDSQPQRLEAILHALEQDDAWQGEIGYRHTSGHVLPTLQSISVVRDDAGHISHLIHIFNDITDTKAKEQRMQRLASLDSLTGLPNRATLNRLISQQLQRAIEQKQYCALLFLDLDKFKPVNDTYGHGIGDKLLESVARRLQHALRDQDVVGRIGGDEFLILTGLLDQPEQAEIIAGKLIRHLTQPFHIDEHQIHIGASIGIACFPTHGETAATLTQKADEAMYTAKKQGRNRFVTAPGSH